MGKPLTTAGRVTCGHEGTVSTTGSQRVVIDGAPVLLKNGIVDKSVAGCLTAPKSDASGTPLDLPCMTVLAVTAGEARKLLVDGAPVILAETLAGSTANAPKAPALVGKTPQMLLSGSAAHARFETE